MRIPDRSWLLAAAFLFLFSCGAGVVTRPEWQSMTQEAKVLYVKSLIGAEKVKDAKGGGGRDYPRPAEEYVARIDAAYASGDQRDVHEILPGLELAPSG